jgi:hypothetical protein
MLNNASSKIVLSTSIQILLSQTFLRATAINDSDGASSSIILSTGLLKAGSVQ